MTWGPIRGVSPDPSSLVGGFCFTHLQLSDWRSDMDSIVVLCRRCTDRLVSLFPAFKEKAMRFNAVFAEEKPVDVSKPVVAMGGAEQQLNAKAKAIYDKYGPDLGAFFKDATKKERL